MSCHPSLDAPCRSPCHREQVCSRNAFSAERPAESSRQIFCSKAYPSEPEIFAVSPFDLFNVTIKTPITFTNLCNTFFKASSKGSIPSNTKKRYEVNKPASTSRTGSLGTESAPKTDTNHWVSAAEEFHLLFVFSHAHLLPELG